MKISLAILFIFFGAITASAQIDRKPVVVKTDSIQTVASDKNADKQTRKKRFKELDLTKEQKGKMKEIMHSGKTAKEVIENNTQLSESEKKKQLRELQKTQAQKVQAILTPEQRETFKASRPNNP